MSKTTKNPKIQLSSNPSLHSSNKPVIALVTAPSLKVARSLSKTILQSRLAACANIVPKLESHYWWQGKLEKSNEVMMILKTTARRIGELEKCVLENHPYDTSEFIVLPIVEGNKKYLDWIFDSVG